MTTSYCVAIPFIVCLWGCEPIPHAKASGSDASAPTTSVSAPARIEGEDRTIALAAPFHLPVLSIGVREGQQIEAGQVVVSLDCADLALESIALREQANSLRLTAQSLARGSRPEEIQADRARFTAASAALEEIRARESRVKLLHEKGMVSDASVDDATRSARVADSELKIAAAKLSQAVAGPRKLDVEAAMSASNAAQAKSMAAEEKIKRCKIRSPTAGVVLRINVRPGEMTEGIGAVVAEIANLSVMHARAEVDERDIAHIKVGTTARIKSESGIDDVGTVVSISPIMGRKQIRTSDPADKTDRDIREVMVRLNKTVPLPVGYRVTVIFDQI